MKNFTLLILLASLNLFCQEYPNSAPNGGRTGGQNWTIEKYVENAQQDSLFHARVKESLIKMALNEKNNFLSANLRNVRSKKKIEEINKQSDNEYQEKLSKIHDEYKIKFEKVNKYRDEWINYLKAEETKKLAQQKQMQKEKELEKIRKEEEKKLRDEAAEIDYQKRIAEYKRIPTDADYLKWKSDYENLLNSGNKYFTNCNAIINKHSFRNAFGEKLYDSSDFSIEEKKRFNHNLDNLYNTLQKFKPLHENKTFYGYWLDNVPIETATNWLRLSNFYYNTNRAY